jgi:hypothetical protein
LPVGLPRLPHFPEHVNHDESEDLQRNNVMLH